MVFHLHDNSTNSNFHLAELQVSDILYSTTEFETKYFLPHLKHCQRKALLIFF